MRSKTKTVSTRNASGMPKMNRRDFLKGAMAAAVVAQIPLSLTEAEEAYEACEAIASHGIEDMGNGWYRCWMGSGTDDAFSTFAKAGDSQWMTLSHNKVRAYFDLRTGEIGKVDVVDSAGPSIGGDCTLFGVQPEKGSTPSTYVGDTN
jgi:hypothetical protein